MTRKSKQSDLGRALANRRARARAASRTQPHTAAAAQAAALGRHTVPDNGRANLASVLDATDLDELMLNAAMADTQFAAQRHAGPLKQAVVVTSTASTGAGTRGYGQKEGGKRGEEKEGVKEGMEEEETVLRIPRRPRWEGLTGGELAGREAETFLEWRRRVAEVEERVWGERGGGGGVMMTPFEKNLEVWRQLWRVVERADVVVQIVDARDPLLYYCEDLRRYVEVEMRRTHVVLVNKADLLTENMVTRWRRYWETRGVQVAFFSAFRASVGEVGGKDGVWDVHQVMQWLEGFERRAPQLREGQRLVVGMCGYPNVGKSSTINVLLESVARANNQAAETKKEEDQEDQEDREEGHDTKEEYAHGGEQVSTEGVDDGHGMVENAPVLVKHIKRVGVSSTPGKTKHFQTLVLSPTLLLCDCPGLVFPNFSSSKSALICAGVLSIDTMRGDFVSPVALIAARIPAALLAAVYGLRFPVLSDGVVTDLDPLLRAREGYVSATMLLDTHARARGFMSDHGKPDQSRSARAVLKDYVSGRIIFAHAPPGSGRGVGGGGGGDGVEEGESGIGPAVHARKGALVYKRQEEAKAEAETERGAGKVQEKGTAEESSNGGEVKARVSGSKKHVHREFTRVHRSYYPAV